MSLLGLPEISIQYLLLIFTGSLGVLQLAGARSGAGHLMLLPRRDHSVLLGLALLLVAYGLFFTLAEYGIPGVQGVEANPRVEPDTSPRYAPPWPRLEGAQLFFYFLGAAATAFLLCVLVGVLRSGQVGQTAQVYRARIRAAIRELFAPRRLYPDEERA